jgi:hypothetical protein
MVSFELRAAQQRAAPFWGSNPDGQQQTQCSSATCLALQDGGIKFPRPYAVGTKRPSVFDNEMLQMAKNPAVSGVTDITHEVAE